LADDDADKNRSSTFEELGSRFYDSLEALKDLLELITPHVIQLDEKYIERILDRSLRLPMVDRVEARDHLKSLAKHLRTKAEEISRLEALKDSGGASADIDAELERLQSEVSAYTFEELWKFARTFPSLAQGLEVLREVGLLPPIRSSRVGILLGALVTTAVSAFDVLLEGIVAKYYRLHAEGVGTDAPEFSLRDLRRYSSIEEALEEAITRRADAFSRESFDEKVKWFKRIGVDVTELSSDWDKATEIFERRHVFVHGGGRATRQYLQKVPNSGLVLGEEIATDQTYVSTALDELTTLGLLLTAKTWDKLEKADNRSSAWLGLMNLDLMVKDRWVSVEHVSKVGQQLRSASEGSRLVFRVNEWLARKRLKSTEVIKHEVEQWDVSALGRRFILAKVALLDQLDRAFEMIPELVSAGDLSRDDLRTWPLLEELREDSRFEPYKPTPRRSSTPLKSSNETSIPESDA
jgi:hypothetical protein